MSMEAIRKFREAVNSNASLQSEVRALGSAGPAAVVALGARHGFAFTAEELASFGESVKNELTDFELEMVAGGTLPVSLMGGRPVPVQPCKEAEARRAASKVC